MKSFLIIALSLIVGWFGHGYLVKSAQPLDYKPVLAVVQQGDTLEEIIHRTQKDYGDYRDWRIIAHQAHQDNRLEQFIYPGQFIILRMAVK